MLQTRKNILPLVNTTKKNYFESRKALLVSMHGKEKVIAPILSEAFDIELSVAKKINTDKFGTFSGEIDRKLSPIEAARYKIAAAVQLYPDFDLFIASEGSFVSHPEIPLISLENELVVLADFKNNFEVRAAYNFINTEVFRQNVSSVQEVIRIAKENNFPENGIILKTTTVFDGKPLVFKNANTFFSLEAGARVLFASSPEIIIESDLRAHKNTQRMRNIAETTQILVANMHSYCPGCGNPGFSIAKNVYGLPCVNCGLPTKQIKMHVKKCDTCHYEQELMLNETSGDPMFCDYCNP